jgi:hypothetical protein
LFAIWMMLLVKEHSLSALSILVLGIDDHVDEFRFPLLRDHQPVPDPPVF